jgi:hypothetical protein
VGVDGRRLSLRGTISAGLRPTSGDAVTSLKKAGKGAWSQKLSTGRSVPFSARKSLPLSGPGRRFPTPCTITMPQRPKSPSGGTVTRPESTGERLGETSGLSRNRTEMGSTVRFGFLFPKPTIGEGWRCGNRVGGFNGRSGASSRLLSRPWGKERPTSARDFHFCVLTFDLLSSLHRLRRAVISAAYRIYPQVSKTFWPHEPGVFTRL